MYSPLTCFLMQVVNLASHENNFFLVVSYCMFIIGDMQWQDLKGRGEQNVFSLALPLEISHLTCVTVRFSAPDTVVVTKSPSGTRRWIVNPFNVDTALHIHEAVKFALAHVFNTWVEPKPSSSEMEIRCVSIVLDKMHKRSDLLCCHSYQNGLHPAMPITV